MAPIMRTRRRSRQRRPFACVLALLLAVWTTEGNGVQQEQTLPIAVRSAGATTGFTGAPTPVLLRLDLEGLGELEVVRLVRRFPAKDWQLAEITRAPGRGLNACK